jgi:hypothetical protein
VENKSQGFCVCGAAITNKGLALATASCGTSVALPRAHLQPEPCPGLPSALSTALVHRPAAAVGSAAAGPESLLPAPRLPGPLQPHPQTLPCWAQYVGLCCTGRRRARFAVSLPLLPPPVLLLRRLLVRLLPLLMLLLM